MQSDWHSDALDSRLALRVTAALIELKHHPIYMDWSVRCAYFSGIDISLCTVIGSVHHRQRKFRRFSNGFKTVENMN
jgi:hypothetical protein